MSPDASVELYFGNREKKVFKLPQEKVEDT